jgi:hypothetical protein
VKLVPAVTTDHVVAEPAYMGDVRFVVVPSPS